MVECEHCGDAFDSEEAYLDHLAAEHESELGAIDRRRIAAQRGGGDDDGLPTMQLLTGGAVLVTVVVFIWFVFFSGGGGGGGGDLNATPTGLESERLPDRGAEQWISQVEQFPDEGNEHVSRDTDIDYARIPPLSGPHYDAQYATPAGFYDEEQELGSLVHTLEHGAVIVYYDPAALNDSAEASLRAWAQEHQGTWSSIVVAPNPNENPEHAFVLTAWRHELTLDSYSAEAVQAFAGEYLGRGPENPVR
jgi:hypothetical protein